MRKHFLRALALHVVPFIGAFLIRIIYLTSRKHFHMPQTVPQEPVIFAFWHGNLLMLPYAYYYLRQSPKIKLLISEHFDGELIARTINYFALDTIRGSSKRGGAKALIQALNSLSSGYDIGITPDGPKGPRFSVSDGAIIMAQKRHAKVIALGCFPSHYWQMRSWDRFVIPKPFCVLNFYASEPIDLEGMELQEAKACLHKALMLHSIT